MALANKDKLIQIQKYLKFSSDIKFDEIKKVIFDSFQNT